MRQTITALGAFFGAISFVFLFPLEKIWEMCALQRCRHGGDRYAIRSLPLQDYFGIEFDELEDAVLTALDTTERTSSMVENLHSRLKPYFYLRCATRRQLSKLTKGGKDETLIDESSIPKATPIALGTES